METDGSCAIICEATRGAHGASESGHVSVFAIVFAPLLALVTCPLPLFLISLTAMLFRPPEIEFYSLDRIAFVVVVIAVVLRTMVRRQQFVAYRVTWPIVVLSIMASVSALSDPFEAKVWSVTAAKFIVPFVFFHVAGLIFEDERDLRWLERFLLAVLGYLSFTAVAFLGGSAGAGLSPIHPGPKSGNSRGTGAGTVSASGREWGHPESARAACD